MFLKFVKKKSPYPVKSRGLEGMEHMSYLRKERVGLSVNGHNRTPLLNSIQVYVCNTST